jgi:hypothetical protein
LVRHFQLHNDDHVSNLLLQHVVVLPQHHQLVLNACQGGGDRRRISGYELLGRLLLLIV